MTTPKLWRVALFCTYLQTSIKLSILRHVSKVGASHKSITPVIRFGTKTIIARKMEKYNTYSDNRWTLQGPWTEDFDWLAAAGATAVTRNIEKLEEGVDGSIAGWQIGASCPLTFGARTR